LFSFCNKEVAMSRLELLTLGDQTDDENLEAAIRNINEFNLDNAHCFDPNEEWKLRTIMHHIGVNRLQRGLNDISRLLESKKRNIQKAEMEKRKSFTNSTKTPVKIHCQQ